MKNGNCCCEHCRQMIYSMPAFDVHRSGTYAGRSPRRCLTAEEMRAKEMRAKGMRPSDKGVWNSRAISAARRTG